MIDRRTFVGASIAAAAGFAGTAARAQRAQFAQSPLVLDAHRLLLDAQLGKYGSHRFILDTGAGFSAIDHEFAKAHRMKVLPGRRPIKGIGGVSDLPWYSVNDVVFGNGLRIDQMVFAGSRGVANTRQDIIGTFGSGLFTTYDSDIDFSAMQWRAWTEGRPNFDGLKPIRSRFQEHPTLGTRILAQASVDEFQGELLVDTGHPGAVLLEGKVAAKAGFWDESRPYAPSQSRGFGSARVPGRLVRGGRLKVGPFVLEKPIVQIHEPGKQVLSGDGTIGLSALQTLNIVTRVSEKLIYAAPSGRDMAPVPYAMSGLWLDGKGSDITIADVGTGSPAAEAGIKVGDRVIGEAFGPLIGKINGPAGSQFSLTIESAGKRRSVTLTLKPYL